MGNDCSQRVCYFDRAFVDTPQGDLNSDGELEAIESIPVMFRNSPTHELFSSIYGIAKFESTEETSWSEGHFYAECSGKGHCNRESGQCDCFSGYEGEGCTRVACPTTTEEKCSGHGTCRRLVDTVDIEYKSWDGAKTQHCVCDPGYAGIACDKRVCPSGDDPITKNKKVVTVCGTFGATTSTLDAEIGNRVFGIMSGAAASLASHDGTNCVQLINEEGMFTKFETVVSRDSVVILENAISVTRAYDGTEQVNEVQTLSVRARDNPFALTYVDEYGARFTTQTIECDGTVQCAAPSVRCVVDPADARFEALDAVATCSAHDSFDESDAAICAAQTYDIVGGCSWNSNDVPDNATAAALACGAHVDSTGCGSATYLNAALTPVACQWVEPAADGGTCVAVLPRLTCHVSELASPHDVGAASTLCSANAARVACESTEYLTAAGDNATCVWDRTEENARCEATNTNYDVCVSETYTGDDTDGTSLPCAVSVWPPVGRETCRTDIENALERLPGQVLRDVDVRDDTPEVGASLGSSAFGYDTMRFDVYYVLNSGDQEILSVVGGGTDGQAYVQVAEKIKGTTENAVCSNRGICDYISGNCKCFQGFTRHDCSKQNALAITRAVVKPVHVNPGAIDEFNKLIQSELPTINEEIESVMPDAYGSCSDGAPSPCDENGNLYEKHKKWEYRVTARWISGLNTMVFSDIELVADPKTQNLTGLTVSGAFAKLPASIHVEQCVTFDRCTTLFDNADACCGTNKQFTAHLNVKCAETTKEIQMVSLGDLNIDDFKITESFGPVSLPSYDVTAPVHAAAQSVLIHYLTDPVLPLNGTDVTLVDFLNHYGKDFLPQIC
eukprot:g530.t1